MPTRTSGADHREGTIGANGRHNATKSGVQPVGKRSCTASQRSAAEILRSTSPSELKTKHSPARRGSARLCFANSRDTGPKRYLSDMASMSNTVRIHDADSTGIIRRRFYRMQYGAPSLAQL